MRRSLPLTRALLAAVALCAAWSCSKSHDTTAHPPPAPPMPDGWKVMRDVEVPSSKLGEVEARLQGKVKAERNTVYDVAGKKVQLNIVVPADTVEQDKMYRILANRKPPFAYLRKGDLLYEFEAGDDAVDDVRKAHDSLAQ